MTPVSTSPLPPVAIPGLPVVLIYVPSRSIVTNVPGPLSSTCLLYTSTIKNVMSSKGSSDAVQPEAKETDEKSMSLGKSIILSIIGIAGIVAGGDLVVDSATDIAMAFGIDETLIGLTIVALGTSLPELVTSIVAAIKGETDIAVGNVVGSNIFNILLVLGLSVTIHPIRITMDSVYDSAILIAVSIAVAVPMIRKHSLSRFWGALMILMYAAYLAYIIMRAF